MIRKTHKTYLKPDDGKCLHYYVYFMDEDLGLCSLRVPTWCPFRLQFYCNGHSVLAAQMSKRNIEYRMLDNAFGWIADFERAQKLADGFRVEMLHRKLDGFADCYCPVVKQFELNYHWSLDQVEFATDIVFQRQGDLQAIYEKLTRTVIHTVKPDNIATFLGRKLNGNYQDEMGNRFNTRIEGMRIKHTMGPVSIKMYDKFRLILRIETTVVNVSFFKHYREVEHKNGTRSMAWAEMKKTIATAWLRCGNSSWRPTGVTWNSFPPSRMTRPAPTSSTKSPSPWRRMIDLIAASTFSIRRTKNCSNHWGVASSISAAFKTKTCADASQARTPARSLA